MPHRSLEKRREYQKTYWKTYRRKITSQWIEQHRQVPIRRRNKMFQCLLPGQDPRCVKCGFSDRRALQIDHVHGGGSRTNHLGSAFLLKEILANPSNFQILCANCNWIKRSENNEVIGRPKLLT